MWVGSATVEDNTYGYHTDIRQALAFAAQCTMTVSVSYGLGLHQGQLSHQQIVASNYWSWIAQVLAILDLAIARCAVIAFLLALQMHTHRNGRWALLTVGALQGLINVAEIGVIFHQCDPPRRLWDMDVPGTCNLIETCLYIGYAQGGMFPLHLMRDKGIDGKQEWVHSRTSFLPVIRSILSDDFSR